MNEVMNNACLDNTYWIYVRKFDQKNLTILI